jgi:hypothetical protein
MNNQKVEVAVICVKNDEKGIQQNIEGLTLEEKLEVMICLMKSNPDCAAQVGESLFDSLE